MNSTNFSTQTLEQSIYNQSKRRRKRQWLELNNFIIIEIYEKDLPKLSVLTLKNFTTFYCVIKIMSNQPINVDKILMRQINDKANGGFIMFSFGEDGYPVVNTSMTLRKP